MHIDEAFPSNYLKASDLQGRPVNVVISHIDREKIGDDQKLILYFVGKKKGMVLNKTNANNIASVYGPETDNWEGADLQLYPTMVDYQGRSVEALRAKALPMKRNGNLNPTAGITSGPQPRRERDDPRTMVNEPDPGFSNDRPGEYEDSPF